MNKKTVSIILLTITAQSFINADQDVNRYYGRMGQDSQRYYGANERDTPTRSTVCACNKNCKALNDSNDWPKNQVIISSSTDGKRKKRITKRNQRYNSDQIKKVISN